MNFDGEATNSHKACQRYRCVIRTQRTFAESKEYELEIGKPSNAKGACSSKLRGLEIERKEEEEADNWEYTKESCRTFGDYLTNEIATRETYED